MGNECRIIPDLPAPRHQITRSPSASATSLRSRAGRPPCPRSTIPIRRPLPRSIPDFPPCSEAIAGLKRKHKTHQGRLTPSAGLVQPKGAVEGSCLTFAATFIVSPHGLSTHTHLSEILAAESPRLSNVGNQQAQPIRNRGRCTMDRRNRTELPARGLEGSETLCRPHRKQEQLPHNAGKSRNTTRPDRNNTHSVVSSSARWAE